MKIILQAKNKDGKEALSRLIGKTDENGSVCKLHKEKPLEISFYHEELEAQRIPNSLKQKQIKQGIRNLMFHKEGVHESLYLIRFE